ncbi:MULTISPECIES: LysR family transcriptional regulator [Pseudomonas]|jgi:DNA-binding transcriptional LysR family regulator|uniref:LysR family transcriptional regulator n=1 Tax=Pseudomonas TaxID=286 RepID=UPI0002A2624F|nr:MULTISPECIES: LysR family transcriptional regulator [Pseudomonas]KRV78263.1 LysR family transcriptional regulator [Pseudomonas citronellolis]KRW79869.1 LysR family transcriptional regulator [Pseudomonas citronellolis]MBB1608981.1 LysR family transcriptional regulator [Pseudomonas sp. UMC76]MBB1641791.1 LysR family transcriptional regulator [Pseudomonas sp. UME83]NTX88987.1 LysR family transcriptional regulator [Pseudomonas sp. UMA643]
MDLLQGMQAFVRVVESGSFSQAARALDMSPSKVSRLIAGLEEQLRARLLQRTTRSVAVTEAGRRYFKRCKGILGEIDDAAAEAAGSLSRASGRLRLHAVTEFGLEHLTPLIAAYRERYPEVSIDLSLTQDTPALLEEGLDVLVTLSRGLPDSAFVAQRLGRVFSVLCAAPGYLHRHGVPRSPEDLREHRCLMLADPLFPDGWYFSEQAEEAPFAFEDVLRVNLPEAACLAAASGMGVCLLPGFVAARALREGRLLRVLPQLRLHGRDVFALYSSRRFLDAKIRTWVEFLKAQLPQAFASDLAVLDDPRYWARPRPRLAGCGGEAQAPLRR